MDTVQYDYEILIDGGLNEGGSLFKEDDDSYKSMFKSPKDKIESNPAAKISLIVKPPYKSRKPWWWKKWGIYVLLSKPSHRYSLYC